jgi:hypothetical protein
MSQHGLIYIISNPKQGKNIFKVGMTSKSIDVRIKQLNSETGLIGKFNLYAYFAVEDIASAEKDCHEKLNKFRIQDNREFFEIEYIKILQIIRDAISPYFLKEYLKIKLSDKDEAKLKKLKKLKKEQYLGTDDEEDDIEEIIKRNKDKINEEQNAVEIRNREIANFTKNRQKIFDQNILKLKTALKKYKHISFYKYYSVSVFQKKRKLYTYGWDIVFCKKDKINESKKINKLYESIVLSFKKGEPYNAEQKQYIKGMIMENYYLATHSTYLPARKYSIFDDNIFRIELNIISGPSLTFEELKKHYKQPLYEDENLISPTFNYGGFFKRIKEYFATLIAGTRTRYGFFSELNDDEKGKDFEYAYSLTKDDK